MEQKNLLDALLEEMDRVQNKIMPVYESIGLSGSFALTMMRGSINLAKKAIAENDVVAMARVYESLKDYSL